MTALARPRRDLLVPTVVAAVLAVLVLGPALGRGVVLAYDLAWSPDPRLTPFTLGTSTPAPRAVPSDAVGVALGWVIGAGPAQALVLWATLVLAGVGAARLAALLVAGTGARRGVVGRCRCRVEPVRPRATGRRPVDRAPRVCRGPAPARGGTARAAGQGARVVARGGARGLRPGWGQHPGPGSAGRGGCPPRAAPSVGSPRAGLRCRTGGVRRVVAARGDGRGPVVPRRGRRVRGAIRHPARRARLGAERWRVLEPRVAPGCPLDDGRRRDCRRARRAHLHRRGARGTGRAPARRPRPGGRGAGPRLAQRSSTPSASGAPSSSEPPVAGCCGTRRSSSPRGWRSAPPGPACWSATSWRRARPDRPWLPSSPLFPSCCCPRSPGASAAGSTPWRARRPAGRRRDALARRRRGRSVSCRGRSTAATSGTGPASR